MQKEKNKKLENEYKTKISREKQALLAYRVKIEKQHKEEQKRLQSNYLQKIKEEKNALREYKTKLKLQQASEQAKIQDEYEAKIRQAKNALENFKKKLLEQQTAKNARLEKEYRERIRQGEAAMEKHKKDMEKATDRIKKEYSAKAKKDKEFMAEYRKKLARQREEEKKRLERRYLARIDEREKTIEKYKHKMAKNSDLLKKEYQKKIKQEQKKLAEIKRELAGKKERLDGRLAEIHKKENLRKNIVDRLKKMFAKHGIDAHVNPKTGEVTIPFHETYFDFGKHILKNGMKSAIDKVTPPFARAIFGNKEIAGNIASLEIVGWASPVYKGNIITGVNTRLEKEALSYNMNLSYKRAKAIFDYIFNTGGKYFKYKKKMLRVTKVSSLSHIVSKLRKRDNFFQEDQKGDNWICKKYNCKEWQKVAIKINLIE